MSEYTVQTDESRVVTLPSDIESVRWSRSRAAPGATVGLEIQTVFCGEGSQLRIQLVDAQGTRHARLSGQLHNNQVDVGLRVPDDAEGGLVAKVEMPNHGLSAESEALQVTPPVRTSSPRWSVGTASPGDILTLTANVHGAPNGERAVVQIFEYEESGTHEPVSLLRTRVHQGTVQADYRFEYTRDTAQITPEWNAPDGYTHPAYFFTVSVLNVETTSHTAKQKGRFRFLDELTVQILDAETGGPYADQKVEVTLPDGSTKSKTTDGSGKIALSEIPPGPAKVDVSDPGRPSEEPASQVSEGRDIVATLPNAAGQGTDQTDAAKGNSTPSVRVATGPSPWRIWIVRRGPAPTA